jgi:predicted ester cyclase
MSPEDLKANSLRAFEAINQRNLAVLDELWTPDVVVHTNSTTILGLEAYKQSLLALFTAFPDLRLTMEDQIVEGDKSVVHLTSRGTHLERRSKNHAAS